MKSQLLNFKNQIILLVCVFALCTCSSVKDKLNVDVEVGTFTIVLDKILVDDDDEDEGGAKSAIVRLDGEAKPRSFSGSQVISLSMLDGLEIDIDKYLSRIVSVDISSASISIVVLNEDNEGKVVKEFLMDATGIDPDFTVGQYNLGEVYSKADLKVYANALLDKLFVDQDEVPVFVKGKTNVAAKKWLEITIKLNDVTFKVKALTN